MIVRQYAPCSLGRSIICLGKQGEINALRVEFDVSAWMAMYPDATVKLMHFAPDRPQDKPVIPTLGVEGTLRVWIVGEEDTAGAGNGVIELLLIDERTGSTIKSATGYTTVLRSPSAGIEAQEAEAGYVRYDVDQSALLTDEQKAMARKNIGAGTGDGTGSGGILKETDPTVPDWAKQPRKPTYTASEVGALPSSYTPPVTSVNGKTGAVALSAQDVRARPDTWTPSASEVGADASGTASGAVAAHNTSGAAHADLRALIEGLNRRLNALADSDDTTLDQLSEIVAYIKSNKSLIDAVTTGKVSVSDIVDNLTTNASGKVLSAAQGVALKAMIDGIVIPTALPNPQPITINGQRYDGSEEVTVTVSSEGGGTPVEIDDTLTQSGKAADAKAVGDELSALNKANAAQDAEIEKLKQSAGTGGASIDDTQISTATTYSSAKVESRLTELQADLSGGSVPANMPDVTWHDDWQYGIGDNTLAYYQCWIPNNVQYDKVRNRFVLVQPHRASHTGAWSNATMHILHPDDPLIREDIAIPAITAMANFVIVGEKYYLYPKNTSAVRYVSHDGGKTWASEALNTHLQHAFGIYHCNGEFYAGCDYEWDEYHYSADGINWEMRNFGFTDANGDQTKEHSFCYWNGSVYAFGRRDFPNANAGGSMTDGSVPGYAVILKLVDGAWTAVDESSILAFQSNTHPIVFDDKIALLSINRISVGASLNYYEYDGMTVKLIKQWTDLIFDGSQGGFTTPCIAYGDGYVIAAYSGLCGGYQRAGTMALFGVYDSSKTVKTYGEIKTATVGHLGYALTGGELRTLPEEDIANLSTPNFDQVTNNTNHDVLVIRKNFPYKYGSTFVHNGMIGTAAYVAMNWQGNVIPFTHGGKLFSTPSKSGYKPMFVEAVFTQLDAEVTVDFSSLKDDTGVYYLPAGGTVSSLASSSAAYFEPHSDEPAGYVLPPATATTLGGIIVGEGLAIDENGVLSLNLTNASGVSF